MRIEVEVIEIPAVAVVTDHELRRLLTIRGIPSVGLAVLRTSSEPLEASQHHSPELESTVQVFCCPSVVREDR